MQEWNHIEHVGEPLAFLFPIEIDSPQRIVERFRSHGDLGGERLFREMSQCTAQLEILCEVVLPVDTKHCLSRLSEIRIALKRHIDGCTRINDTLIENKIKT